MKLASDRPERLYPAFLWTVASAIGFGCMGLTAKLLSSDLPSSEVVFFRSSINFLVVLAILLVKRETLVPRGVSVLILRALTGFVALFSHFYGLSKIPLSVVAVLIHSGPIFVVIFARLFLKEAITRKVLLWIALAWFGIALIQVNPGAGLGSFAWYGFPSLVVLFGAACTGLTFTLIRSATARFSNEQIIAYFTGLASVFSIPLMMLAGFVTPSPADWAMIIGMGLSATMAQFAMTQALRLARAPLVSGMGLMTPGLSILLGHWFLGETLHLVQLIGITVIFISVFSILRSQR